MLWAYYRVPSSVFGKPDRIYPTFIVTRMPHGVSGLLINTAIAGAKDPVTMARAMKLATEAGRLAYLAGRIPKKLYGSASSPLAGVIGTA